MVDDGGLAVLPLRACKNVVVTFPEARFCGPLYACAHPLEIEIVHKLSSIFKTLFYQTVHHFIPGVVNVSD